MRDLIEALTILSKYGNPDFPTHCEHDEMLVVIDPAIVSEEDKQRLEELDFIPNENDNRTFISYRFGSA